MNTNTCSGRTLAFLGDAVLSLLVREYLIESGEGKGKKLQKDSISYVSAKAQATFYTSLHEQQFFTEWEEEVFHRGRNANDGATPKSTDVQTYRISTGFEAIFGALQLEGKQDRIREIFDEVLKVKG